MNQVHRPQRTERKDPFPQIPFAVEGTDVPGDKAVGWLCCAGLVLFVLAALA